MSDPTSTVDVRDYPRLSGGHLQHVRRHKRRPRRWFRRPKWVPISLI